MGDNSCFTLLLVGSLLATLDADVGPKFINNPEPIVAPLGDEVEFECSLDIRADQVKWKHNGRLLPYVFNKTAKSQLIFKMDNKSQIGDYQCIAWYGASAVASNPAKLSLAELGPMPPQSDTSNNKYLEVSEGNNVLIKCRVPYSNPAAVIQYYKNNETLQVPQILNTGALLLTNVTSYDSGRYTCSVTNTYVYEKPMFLPGYDLLNVVRRMGWKSPQFSYPPPTQYNVQGGANVTLECVAYGEPVPRVTWTRRNGSMPKNRSLFVPAGLSLINVSVADEGTYVCKVENGVSPGLELNVELVLQEPASVVKGPSDSLVKEGGKVRLECTVRGKPSPRVTWLLNGEPVRDDPHIVTNGSRMQISEVLKRHAGMYQCMAENELGSSFGSSTLQVEPRQFTAKSASDLKGLTRETYHRGEDSLRQHSGSKHKKGKSKSEMVPPTRPNVTRLTDTSVMVRWHVTPNKGLPILFFKVQYRELSSGKGSRWMTCNEDIPSHVGSYEVKDLTPDRYYRFRIAAVYSNNDHELSPNSARFHLSSGPSKQTPPAPRLLHTSAAGPESIQIIWDFQNNSKHPIEGFYVYCRATSSAGDYIKATIEGEWTRSYIITHLNQDTAYDIKLQSFTVNAASEFSEILTQKTEKGPTVSPPPTEPPSTNIESEVNETSKSSNQLYVTLGAVLGGLALLLTLCLGIFFCNKHRHTTSASQDGDGPDKQSHIQLEPITVNGHLNRGNGHVPKSNGYLSSKMNITSNPLADTDEEKNQNVMEISFITRTSTSTTTTNQTSNNCTRNNHRGGGGGGGGATPRPDVGSQQNKTETSSSKIEINHRVSQICEDGYSSSEEFCEASEAVLQSCALESDSWRCDVASVRTVENYV